MCRAEKSSKWPWIRCRLRVIHSYTIVITVKCKCHSAGSEHRVQSGCPFVPRHWLEPQGWIRLKAFTHRMHGVNNSDEYKKPTLLTECFHTENECQAVEDKQHLLFFQTFALRANTSTNHEGCAEWSNGGQANSLPLSSKSCLTNVMQIKLANVFYFWIRSQYICKCMGNFSPI